MGDSGEKKADGSKDIQAKKSQDRLSEATSDETLSDVEAEQKIEEAAKTSERHVLAPDAQPGEPRKDRNDAGPM